MRSVFQRVQIGTITQGSIITGCIAEEFPEAEAFGCIITPRCDLGHEGKVRSVHYLPIVSFRDWYEKVAKKEIFEQWKSDLRGSIDNEMKNLGMGEKITSLGLEKTDLLKLIDSKCKKKQQESIQQKIEDFYSDYNSNNFIEFLATEKGKHVDYLKQLKDNKIASCYLIEKWADYLPCDYYVIMLRDVRRLSCETASLIAKGALKTDIEPINHQLDDLCVSSNEERFYYVDGQISSPYIEHILQAFMYNFNRIGVEDMPLGTHEKLIRIAKTKPNNK